MSDSIENILMNLVRDSNNIIASNTETIAKNNEEIKNFEHFILKKTENHRNKIPM